MGHHITTLRKNRGSPMLGMASRTAPAGFEQAFVSWGMLACDGRETMPRFAHNRLRLWFETRTGASFAVYCAHETRTCVFIGFFASLLAIFPALRE